MSWASLEREILAVAKNTLNNPRLRMKDIMAWNTGPIKPEPGELAIRLPGELGVTICILAIHNKRDKCSHVFRDTKHCIHCGWIPQPEDFPCPSAPSVDENKSASSAQSADKPQ